MVLHQRIEQRRIGGRRHGGQRRRSIREPCDEARRLLARLAGPEPRGPLFVIRGRKPFREADMGLHERAERGARLRHEGGEGRGALLQPGEPAVDGRVAPLQCRPQAAKPRRGPADRAGSPAPWP